MTFIEHEGNTRSPRLLSARGDTLVRDGARPRHAYGARKDLRSDEVDGASLLTSSRFPGPARRTSNEPRLAWPGCRAVCDQDASAPHWPASERPEEALTTGARVARGP